MEWVWASGDGVEEDVLLFDLVPATTPQMGESEAELICHSKDVVVIDEPSSWPGMVSWEAPEDEWTSPANRVVGGQFPYTGLGVCTRNSRRRAWRHSMVCTLGCRGLGFCARGHSVPAVKITIKRARFFLFQSQ